MFKLLHTAFCWRVPQCWTSSTQLSDCTLRCLCHASLGHSRDTSCLCTLCLTTKKSLSSDHSWDQLSQLASTTSLSPAPIIITLANLIQQTMPPLETQVCLAAFRSWHCLSDWMAPFIKTPAATWVRDQTSFATPSGQSYLGLGHFWRSSEALWNGLIISICTFLMFVSSTLLFG